MAGQGREQGMVGGRAEREQGRVRGRAGLGANLGNALNTHANWVNVECSCQLCKR